MVDVLIVEDELVAMERISSFKFWSSGVFRIAGAVKNGQEALDYFKKKKPDVIITDIEMPVMNGIELIRTLREKNIELPIIILSCHESFEYAREAVSLGVREYILKDFMEEDSIRLALSKAVKPQQAVSGEERVEGHRSAADDGRLLDSVLRGGGSAADVFPGRTPDQLALLLIHIDGFSISSHEPARFLREINSDLAARSERGLLCEAAYADAGDFWVLLEGPALGFAEDFFGRMEGRKTSVTIAAGKTFAAGSDLRTEALAVRELYGYRLFLGRNRIIIPETITSFGGRNPADIRKKIELIKTAVHERDSGSCFSLLRELYDRDLPGMLKYNYLEYVNLRLLSLILSFEERGEINIREITGKEYLPIKELELMETVSDMREWFENIFSRIFKLEEDDPASRVTNRNVLKVINIIKTRFDEDLSLEDLADSVGVHKVYLSRLFKKEAGRTYYDFLQSYRISKAVQLLSEERLKMYEIAVKSGFKNYDQFAVVFKKMKGVSPTEYRRDLFS